MKTEKSCGAVVFTRAGDTVQYVIIRQTNGDYGFPKGHMEQGENETQTALREIYEEVGLRPVLLDGFREEVSYPLLRRPGRTKKVVYFLAEYSGQMFSAQPEEVADIALMTYVQAMERLKFPESKRVLESAECYIRNHLEVK